MTLKIKDICCKVSPVILLLFTLSSCLYSQKQQAKWITAPLNSNRPNTWIAFKKTITIKNIPPKVITKIAADSKYWLWINGIAVVFEGSLKRGPLPNAGYYDEIDIAPYLTPGENNVELLLWYFGKDGFSHKSSGYAGLFLDCSNPAFGMVSDASWKCKVLECYQTALAPFPNYRLPESNILFDATKADAQWRTGKNIIMNNAIEISTISSWTDKMVIRPVPLFKNFGIANYEQEKIKQSITHDTFICKLPYNAQVTPYLQIDAGTLTGKKIMICTDNYLYHNGGDNNIRAEYITREGIQEYESLGWINGHYIYYIIPKGIKVLSLKFRETGYNTNFDGSFKCNDPFFNLLWNKARRSLYVNMRDNYMDCPDRERAQWTGDAVICSAASFYTFSTSANDLSKKWLLEFFNWQRKDSSLYAPVPSGNWDKELPDQNLATIGYYGLWNYYLNSDDKKTLSECYDKAKQYLLLWQADGKGTMQLRSNGWTWGDWGNEKDTCLIFNCFYYIAIQGMRQAAAALNKKEDVAICEKFIKNFKVAFNNNYWTGNAYRSAGYNGKTDDRVQALAVVSGLADKEKYKALREIFCTEEHASPYMEKYVIEALFKMNEPELALTRIKKRFGPMVNHPAFTTLWEGWNFNDPTYGGGTINHAWSSWVINSLSQYVCGIAPLTPGYKTFQVIPQPGNIKNATAAITSVAGLITASFINESEKFVLKIKVPAGTTAIAGFPGYYKKVWLKNKLIWQAGNYLDKSFTFNSSNQSPARLSVKSGDWEFTATP